MGFTLLEFLADKIPLVDTVWDAVHTVIRPPAAALLAYGAAGAAPPEWRWGAALLAGGVALTSHGSKASVRAAANTSPEPFSNWALSLGEDTLAVWLTWLATVHPAATVVVVVVLLAVAAFVIFHLFRFLRRAVRYDCWKRKSVSETQNEHPCWLKPAESWGSSMLRPYDIW